ncbi:unnamed protein product, partial [Mesorhabditis belari]|uniref:Cytochrome P450 n=1 Tax=Mesorhabditis belari TaxID=2138241 RepID=A0AAF3J9H8_9BILA
MGVVGVALLVSFISFLIHWISQKAKFVYDTISALQGPAALPLIGNLHQLHVHPVEFFEQAQGISYLFQKGNDRIARVWLAGMPFVVLYGADEVEAVLGSNKLLHKPIHYSFLSAWIGQGLLISDPNKWRPRRKLLTPTFHYDILKDFVEVYNRHSRTLLAKFQKLAAEGDFTDVFHTVTLCTLDIICEAALGTCIDAQNNPNSPYLEAVFKIKHLLHRRMINPQYYPDFIFKLFGDGREQARYVKVLHDFTSKAIYARKKLADEAGGVNKLIDQEKAEGRRRMAFLDLMLDMHARGELEMSGIQEEVDTFTFEGHDTTSTTANWFFHLMGAHPEYQVKCQQEIDEVIGPEDRHIAFDDLGRFRFLEACLKETMRLYPAVPLIARYTAEEAKIKDYTLPKGTNIIMVPSMVHKDPRYWEDPEIFRPERFLENDVKHPYAYIPFSAGARNCIGQRFAIMEEKTIAATVLRNLKIESLRRTDQMRVAAELIIRPLYGNHLKFRPRDYGDYTIEKSAV